MRLINYSLLALLATLASARGIPYSSPYPFSSSPSSSSASSASSSSTGADPFSSTTSSSSSSSPSPSSSSSSLSSSRGFALRVRVADGARDLSPSVQGHYLGRARVAQGVYAGVVELRPQDDHDDEPDVYYLNGTTAGNSSSSSYYPSAADVVTDIPGVYPLRLSVAGSGFGSGSGSDNSSSSSSVTGSGSAVSLLVAGAGTPLWVATDDVDRVPVLHDNDNNGTWAACVRATPLGGVVANLTTVRYFYGDGDGDGGQEEAVAAGCAPLDFVVECAALDDLPANNSSSSSSSGSSAWNHDSALRVPCLRRSS
ncbi:hypothetical protein GGR56DRAFT_680382 [Xylariaceae sp. FL0804]|nr:hypothetical protein GGR56DRAFT_680382 [Xylariaceae sp. FL0804]